MASIERPAIVKDKHLVFLDALRESGAMNMYGAAPWLRNAFPSLRKGDDVTVLSYWMRSFTERHPPKAQKSK